MGVLRRTLTSKRRISATSGVLMSGFFEGFPLYQNEYKYRSSTSVKLMKTYVSRSGRDCSWKIPKACMNSCWNVPTLRILLNSIQQKNFGHWKSKILSLRIATGTNGEDLLSVICPSDVTVTSTTLENSYILILTLPWLQVDTCSKSIISFSICNSIQKYSFIENWFFPSLFYIWYFIFFRIWLDRYHG